MDIIVLASELSSTRGGIEKSLFDICRGLDQKGHNITLLYEKPGDQLIEYQKFCKHLYQVNSYRISRQNPFIFLTELTQIKRRFPVERNYIIYSSQYYNFFFASLLAFLSKSPLVCHLRLPPPTHLKFRLNNIFTVIKERSVLNRVTQFIAVSNSTKNAWIKELNLSEEKFDVVYNGIDLGIFKSSEDYDAVKARWENRKDKKIISYVGRIDRHKGVEVIIKALALLGEKRKDIELLIAGKGVLDGENYTDSLSKLADSLGVGENTRFVGHLANPVALYQASDITVVPSIWAEPFGRVVIESMACQTPVIASNIGGIPEAITDSFSHHLFEPGDEKDLARIIEEIIDWRETLPDLGERCRNKILEKFQLESALVEVEQSLLRACSKIYDQ